MVQGELGGNEAMEVMSAHGTCNAAMLSLKYAYMAILSGMIRNAICAGSETFSSWMHARNYEKEIDRRKELEKNPYIAFEKDFLRWMLSDGASALLLQDKPNKNGISLKVEWIEVRSFAHELEACMYAGCTKDKNGRVTGWREMDAGSQYDTSVFSLKQDAKLLQEYIVPKGGEVLKELISKRELDIDSIDYFLPHISSMFFKAKIQEHFQKSGFGIPFEKWLLNLDRIGNIGSASPFFLIEELFHSGKLKKDDKILVMVPESARFSYTYMFLTAVSF
jgi:3-oxoacyl-[acyl-carrier-protein] synthase-3